MRFLLYFPLPLLLILISFVSSTYADYKYTKKTESNRIRRSNDGIKPMAVAGEDINNLSFDELEKKYNEKKEEHDKLNATVIAAKAAWEQKEAEAKGPREEYETKKKEWEEMDAAANKEKNDRDKAERERDAANAAFSTLDDEFDPISDGLNEAKKAFEKAENDIPRIESAGTRLPLAEARFNEMKDNKECKKKKDEIKENKPKYQAMKRAKSEFDSSQSLVNAQQTKKDNCQSPCDDIEATLNNLIAKRNSKEIQFKTANETYNQAVEASKACDDEYNALDQEIKELTLFQNNPNQKKETTELRDELKNKVEKLQASYDEIKPKHEAAKQTLEEKETALKEADDIFTQNPKTDERIAAENALFALQPLEEAKNEVNAKVGELKTEYDNLNEKYKEVYTNFESLKQVYEEKSVAEQQKGKDNPGTGSTPMIAGAVIGVVLLVVIAFLVFMVLTNKRNGRKPLALVLPFGKGGKKDAKEAPMSSAKPSGKPASDPSAVPQGSSKSDQAAAPVAAPANETPPPPAVKSNDAKPADVQKMQLAMPYHRDLDNWQCEFDQFLSNAKLDEKVRTALEKAVTKKSIVRSYKEAIKIFKTEERTGEILVLYNGKHLLTRLDARLFRIIALGVDELYENDFVPYKNPNEDPHEVHVATELCMFVVGVDMMRKTLKDMLVEKALTKASQDRWKKMTRELRAKEQGSNNRLRAGHEQEDFTEDEMRAILENASLDDLLKMFADSNEEEEKARNRWGIVKEKTLDFLIGKKATVAEVEQLLKEADVYERIYVETGMPPTGATMSQLRKKLTAVDRFLGNRRGEFAKRFLDGRDYVSGSSKVDISEEFPKEGEVAVRAPAGRGSDKKSDRSDEDVKVSRSPPKDAIANVKKAQDNIGKVVMLHGQRIITEDGRAIPYMKRIQYSAPGVPRKEFTDERCDKEIARIFAGVKGPLIEHDAEDTLDLINTCIERLENDKKFIDITDKEKISVSIADIHGNVDSVLSVFKMVGGVGSKRWLKHRFIFMGDYVDRGNQSLDVVKLMFCLKIRYPDNIVMLRGNHECYQNNIHYGFFEECQDRFKDEEHKEVGRAGKDMHFYFNYAFSFMSIVCLHNRLIHSHGGLTRVELTNLDEINEKIPQFVWEASNCSQMAHDSMWTDLLVGGKGWTNSPRGTTECGEDIVELFLEKFNERVSMILRGHQVMNNGLEFFAGKMVCSLFSTSNYNKPGYPNRASVMFATPDLVVWFVIFVGYDYQIVKCHKVELTPDIRTKVVHDHNMENLIPSLHVANVMAADAENKSETVRC